MARTADVCQLHAMGIFDNYWYRPSITRALFRSARLRSRRPGMASEARNCNKHFQLTPPPPPTTIPESGESGPKFLSFLSWPEIYGCENKPLPVCKQWGEIRRSEGSERERNNLLEDNLYFDGITQWGGEESEKRWNQKIKGVTLTTPIKMTYTQPVPD